MNIHSSMLLPRSFCSLCVVFDKLIFLRSQSPKYLQCIIFWNTRVNSSFIKGIVHLTLSFDEVMVRFLSSVSLMFLLSMLTIVISNLGILLKPCGEKLNWLRGNERKISDPWTTVLRSIFAFMCIILGKTYFNCKWFSVL